MAYVCRSVAGLYRRPSYDSEILTQEILGHRVRAGPVNKGFTRCTLRDGYAGWMPEGSLAVTGKYAATHVVGRRIASLGAVGAGPVAVSMGSILRVTSTGPRRHAVELPDGRSGWIAAGSVTGLTEWERKPPSVPELLRRLMGTPYLWGGKSAFGFDCSGLVQFVMGLAGVALPRDSGDQARRGRLIRDLRRLRPLDLVFFGSGSGIDHVAIHLGDLKIAHASAMVRVESLDRSSPGFREDLLERFRFARRIAGVRG
jgi:hypothetical protein